MENYRKSDATYKQSLKYNKTCVLQSRTLFINTNTFAVTEHMTTSRFCFAQVAPTNISPARFLDSYYFTSKYQLVTSKY